MSDIEQLQANRVGIPGLAGRLDDRYVIYNFSFIDQYLDRFDQVKNLVPGAQVIINAYNDPYNYTHISNRIRANGLQNQCTILIGDLELAHEYRDMGFRYFGFFWHWWYSWYYQLPVAGAPPMIIQPDWRNRAHRLSCLNRNPSYSRFVTMYELQQQSWFDQVYSSFGNVDLLDYLRLDHDVRTWFYNNADRFPFSHQPNYQGDNCWAVNVPAYAHSYANLITETYSSFILLSEKTIKPLVAGNLVFLAAASGAAKQLRLMQFDIDFEGVDLSYDTVPDCRARITAMVKEIDRVYQHLPDMWHANLHRLKHNRDWVLSTDFRNFLLNDVKDIFPDVQPKI